MSWLRARTKRLSMLALFALAVQLGLSFGHFHRDGLVTISLASVQTSVSAPDTSSDVDARGNLCAICATVAMANTAVDAAPPVLPVPVAFTRTSPFRLTVVSIAEPRRAHAQSRAPPVA